LLHSPCNVFKIPQVDGAIGYHQIENCAVVMGAPICLPQDIEELTKAFHLHCEESALNIVFLLAYQDFAHWAINNGYSKSIQIGSELSINPTNFQIKHKLRWKINHSIEQGVRVKEYKNFDPLLENQMTTTVHTWLKQRHGPQIHLGDINFFNSDAGKRIFYAEQNDKIIGILALTPVDRYQGWVMRSCFAVLDSPAGTTEHLISSAINILANENCHYLCLGVSSGTKLGETVGLTPFGKTLSDLIFKMASRLFKLNAKSHYLNKYHPNLRSTFLLCRGKLTISELLAIKCILNVKLW
jgi:lysylphosphatidylglycerol synthetase-like protein (DUF2156 family)